MKARDWDFKLGRLSGGVTFYPYQITLGISLRYWPCIFAPTVRVHFLMFKFWLAISLRSTGMK